MHEREEGIKKGIKKGGEYKLYKFYIGNIWHY